VLPTVVVERIEDCAKASAHRTSFQHVNIFPSVDCLQYSRLYRYADFAEVRLPEQQRIGQVLPYGGSIQKVEGLAYACALEAKDTLSRRFRIPLAFPPASFRLDPHPNSLLSSLCLVTIRGDRSQMSPCPSAGTKCTHRRGLVHADLSFWPWDCDHLETDRPVVSWSIERASALREESAPGAFFSTASVFTLALRDVSIDGSISVFPLDALAYTGYRSHEQIGDHGSEAFTLKSPVTLGEEDMMEKKAILQPLLTDLKRLRIEAMKRRTAFDQVSVPKNEVETYLEVVAKLSLSSNCAKSRVI